LPARHEEEQFVADNLAANRPAELTALQGIGGAGTEADALNL